MNSHSCEKVDFPVGWRLVYGNLGGDSKSIVPKDMAEYSCREEGDAVVGEWRGHEVGGPEFRVEVRLRTDRDGLRSGVIGYSGWSGSSLVEEICFPVLEFPSAGKRFYRGFDLGSYRDKIMEPVIPEAMSHLQFFAASDGESGVYCECRDSRHFAKSQVVERVSDSLARVQIMFHMPCGASPKVSYELPYVSRFGEYRGDWFEACEIYRQWACQQPWYADRQSENPLRDIGLWVWNRGPSTEVVPPVLELAKAMPGVPIALDWYWWHHNPYDTDYPDFWPPREGVETFRQAVDLLKSHGVFVQTYVNGALWDSDNPSWSEGGSEAVIMNRDGQPKRHDFNKYNHHRLGFICGGHEAFAKRLLGQLRSLHEAGLCGQYLDVIGCVNNFLCFHKGHDHERNGGTYQVDGYRRMLQDIRREFPGYPLSTEYCNEAFMGEIDGMITCGSTSSEHFNNQWDTPVPLFTAVYHKRTGSAVFGNYAHPDGIMPWDSLWPAEDRWPVEKPWHRLYPEQFYIEVLRCVIWGIQPMVCNLQMHIFTDPEYEEIRRFMVATGRFYYENRDYLFDGTMESPAGFSCGEREVKFLARMIFTKEELARVITKRLPSLLHCVWRNPEGRSCLFLGNYTGEEQSWTFRGRSGVVPAHECLRVEL